MEEICQYILSVICVCVLSCMLQLLFASDSNMKPLIKICTGLLVTLIVFMPIRQKNRINFDISIDDFTADSRSAIKEGEASALETLTTLIKQNTQSYILEKANELGMDIQADVVLTNDLPPVPYTVTVRGMYTPFAQKQLSYYLYQNLGISEEHQTWIS